MSKIYLLLFYAERQFFFFGISVVEWYRIYAGIKHTQKDIDKVHSTASTDL